MTTFFLVRHGEPQWSLAQERQLKGWGNDLVPLTLTGIGQAERTARDLAAKGAGAILSSPMTRALQTAAIISHVCRLQILVEFGLHEWVPDLTYNWQGLQAVQNAESERSQLGGEWPEGERRDWEPLSSVRYRAAEVLKRYTHLDTAVVVAHAVLIQSLTFKTLSHGGVIEFKLDQLEGLQQSPLPK